MTDRKLQRETLKRLQIFDLEKTSSFSSGHLFVVGFVQCTGQAAGEYRAQKWEKRYANCSPSHYSYVGAQEIHHLLIAPLKSTEIQLENIF